MNNYHFMRVSGNAKTGPIPVTTSSRSTCPKSCPFMNNGCYAEYGHLSLHWNKVSNGTRGGSLAEVCEQIKQLPKNQLWRWAQAGDLPGDGVRLNARAVASLVKANAGKRGFGYTHYDPALAHNASVIAKANEGGFVINLSANSLAHADQLVRMQIAPVVVVLPSNQTEPLRTPDGNLVAVCPASVRDDIDCARCGVCAVPGHKAIIGFPAHGTGAKKIVFQPMTRRYDTPARATPRQPALA